MYITVEVQRSHNNTSQESWVTTSHQLLNITSAIKEQFAGALISRSSPWWQQLQMRPLTLLCVLLDDTKQNWSSDGRMTSSASLIIIPLQLLQWLLFKHWRLPSLITTLTLQLYHHQRYLPLPKKPFFVLAGLSDLIAIVFTGLTGSLTSDFTTGTFAGVGNFTDDLAFVNGLSLDAWRLFPKDGGLPIGDEWVTLATFVPWASFVGQHW